MYTEISKLDTPDLPLPFFYELAVVWKPSAM